MNYKWFLMMFFCYTYSALGVIPCKIEPTVKNLKFQSVATGFSYPIGIYSNKSGKLLVWEQRGKVFEVDLKLKTKSLWADFSSLVSKDGMETGLLGLAIDPKSKNVFLNYTADKNPMNSYIARFKLNNGKPDPKSKSILLKVKQPYSNHNGGDLKFGPDGYLYISLGDGGSGGDPDGNGQNLNTLLGSILRIDVSDTETVQYSIPKDNPFINHKSRKHEIYAYGLRNVWRFSFDRQTKELWAADVGQNKLEEIDIILPGRNYGWNIREGNICYDKSCKGSLGFVEPIWVYGRQEGVSVTGGYVYRGKKIANLIGHYVFADFATGNMWAIQKNNKDTVESFCFIKDTDYNVSTFGEDVDGELYFADYSSGAIYKIE